MSDEGLSAVSNALDVDGLSCGGLTDLKVYTSYSTDLKAYVFLEEKLFAYRRYENDLKGNVRQLAVPYYYQKEEIPYSGDLAGDLKALVDELLSSRCNIKIVHDPQTADIVINGKIKKAHSQVIDLTDRYDKTFSEHHGAFHMKISTILDVESAVNDKALDYEELLSVKIDITTDSDGSYIVVGGTEDKERVTNIKTYLNNEFLLSQYTSVSIYSRVTALVYFSNSSFSDNSLLRVYDDDDGKLLKEFRDIDPEKSSDDERNEFYQYKGLYTTGYGNLLYLVNDYSKRIIEKIDDEVRD